MPLTTRQPTGLPAWPIVVVAGRPSAGKSWESALFSASKMVDRTFWIEVGETTADQYGAIPGVRYEIVDHDGSYASIRNAIRDAAAEPIRDPAHPNCIVIDTFGRVWDLLSDEAQVMANRREAARAQKYKKPAPDADADFTVGPDLWNRAKKRWTKLFALLQAFPGPVLILARLDENTVMDATGSPTKEKVWKVKAQKDLAFDADVVVEARTARQWDLTKVRSVTYRIDEGSTQRLKDFSIEGLFRSLGLDQGTSPRNAVALDPDAIDPDDIPPRLPDDFDDLMADAEKRLSRGELVDLREIAIQVRNDIAVAKVEAAGKRASARLKALQSTYPGDYTPEELLEFEAQDAAIAETGDPA